MILAFQYWWGERLARSCQWSTLLEGIQSLIIIFPTSDIVFYKLSELHSDIRNRSSIQSIKESTVDFAWIYIVWSHFTWYSSNSSLYHLLLVLELIERVDQIHQLFVSFAKLIVDDEVFEKVSCLCSADLEFCLSELELNFFIGVESSMICVTYNALSRRYSSSKDGGIM